jgi:hypothetical protein
MVNPSANIFWELTQGKVPDPVLWAIPAAGTYKLVEKEKAHITTYLVEVVMIGEEN